MIRKAGAGFAKVGTGICRAERAYSVAQRLARPHETVTD
jgi:hypothetical protein